MTYESAQVSGIDTPTTGHSAPRLDAGRRTMLLAVLLTVGSIALLGRYGDVTRAALADRHRLAWWAVALLTIVAELVPVQVDVRRATYTFTLSEVPMAIGLFFASPVALISGRLLGELIVLVAKERQHPRKVTLNLSSCLTGTTVLLVVFRALGDPRDVDRPWTWLVVLAAVSAACVVGYITVGTVIRWHGAPSSLVTFTITGLLTVPANTALGLVAAVLLEVSPWTTLLLSSVVLFLVASYRTYSKLSERYASLELLHDFTRLVSGARRPDAVLEAILHHSRELLGAERAVIWLEDDGGHVGIEVGRTKRTDVLVPPNASFLLGEWFGDGTEARLGSANGRHGDPAVAEVLRSRHCVVAPITEAGVIVGLIAAIDRSDRLEGFRPRDAKLFTTLAAHASAALENGRLIDRLHDEARTREHEALHDPLTGLPNRVLFAERLRDELDAADRGHRPGPVVGLMDLDDFKRINDHLGHHCGDQALVEVARRLLQVAGSAVTVARLSGDEFALLAPAWSEIELDRFAARLRRAVAEPLVLGGKRLEIGISIGLAAYDGTGDDGAVLMRRADAAMYRAKQAVKEGDGLGYALAHSGEGLGER